MIKSMTGFGRSEIERGNRKITVEIKSVNHRFLENSIKMPKKLNIFEARIRDTIKKYASRGKIDVFITYEDNSESNVSLKFNESIAREYMNIFRQMEERFNIRNDITVGALSRYPEVITMEESQEDEEELWNFINEAIYSDSLDDVPAELKKLKTVTDNLDIFINTVDAVYIRSFPTKHYEQIKKVLNAGKHVLCESPITLDKQQCKELFELAQAKGCILMEAIKTAYNTAFSRLVLLAKSGKIGDIVSVDATCTSLKELAANEVEKLTVWNSAFDWGPTAMLPVFEILGTNYKLKRIVTHYIDKERNFDDFTKMDFTYDNAVASIKVGMGVKSEGELIVSGTKGYIYVPAPWWKTDYFELRYENAADNRRYFYQLDGEGIRYELVAFVRAIDNGRMAR